MSIMYKPLHINNLQFIQRRTKIPEVNVVYKKMICNNFKNVLLFKHRYILLITE